MNADQEPRREAATPHVSYVAEHRSYASAVVDAVSAVSGRPACLEDSETGAAPLEPLFEAIDPDALDAILGRGDPTTVEFSYCGYRVVAESTGVVTVTES